MIVTPEDIKKLGKQAWDIIARVTDSAGGDNELTVEEVRRGFQAILERKYRDFSKMLTYPVKPDTSRSLEEMSAAAGQTSLLQTFEEGNFSLTEGNLGEQVLELHYFSNGTSDAEATQQLDARGYERVTELPVILAFLETHPDLQLQVPIITGSVLSNPTGRIMVFQIVGTQSKNLRKIVCWTDQPWPAAYRFLVRHK